MDMDIKRFRCRILDIGTKKINMISDKSSVQYRKFHYQAQSDIVHWTGWPPEVGKVTFKSNGDEELNDDSL